MASDEQNAGTDHVRTNIGTRVVETPKRVYNPTTDKWQDLRNLSEDGYCRQFLATLSHFDNVGMINVDAAPFLSFDKDRWEMEEQEGSYILVKREAESDLGELVLDE